MNDIEWEEFLKEIINKGSDVNLRTECEKKHVGLNTLYRKLNIIIQTNYELYSTFVSLHPYKPREVQGLDFEQLMRESILTGESQRGLASKYNVDPRTLQRKFKKISTSNPELYKIYQHYSSAKRRGQEIDTNYKRRVEDGYVPPKKPLTPTTQIEKRREDFRKRLEVAKKDGDGASIRHLQEQIIRINNQMNHQNSNNGRGED